MNKVVWSLSNSVYENLALEEQLMKELGEDEIILYLWINDPCVILGCSQCAFLECNLKFCHEQGIRVARRLSGGGCVYQDPGNVNFSFFYRRASRTEESCQMERVSHMEPGCPTIRDCQAPPGCQKDAKPGEAGPKEALRIGEALRELVRESLEQIAGLPVTASGNDLLINGRKISGLAYYEEADKVLFHGTVMVDVDCGQMKKTLTVSTRKLESKGIDSVSKRVINLSECRDGVTAEMMAKELESAFCRRFVPVKALRKLQSDEAAVKRYRSPEWICGESPQCRTVLEIPAKKGLYQLVCEVKEGVVVRAFLYSDSHSRQDLGAVAKMTEGMPYREDIIAEEVNRRL